MARKKFDVGIVGGGISGLFSALILYKSGLKTAVIEKDKIYGKGFNGKLNFPHHDFDPRMEDFEIGGKRMLSYDDIDRYGILLNNIFTYFGGKEEWYGNNSERIYELIKKSNREGIEFVPLKQRKIGEYENTTHILQRMWNYVRSDKDIRIIENTEVRDLDPEKGVIYAIKDDGKEMELVCKYIILAVGQRGAKYLERWAKKHGISVDDKEKKVELGVVAETPSTIWKDIINQDIALDPKFIINTKRRDDQNRTVGFNHEGIVISYPRCEADQYSLVNGKSIREKTNNTNFTLIGTYRFTEPFDNPNEWGRDLAKLTTKLGGGNPIVQRLKDLRSGRRSTESRIRNNRLVQPTLDASVPGDISLAYPGRVVDNILDSLDALDKVVSGVADDSTLIYAPAIRFYSHIIDVDKNMETNLDGIYAVGDGAGLSRGVTKAAITGMIAASSILDYEKSESPLSQILYEERASLPKLVEKLGKKQAQICKAR